MSLILALLAGRCKYALEDGGYDLSRFREDPALTAVPDGLRGIVPTNREAARAIAALNDGRDLRFVIIGDTISDHNATFRTFLDEIAALDPPPSFIVHLGDRVVSPVVDYYGTYLRAISHPPCPILHVDGNHDVREEGERISRAFFGDRDFFFDWNDMRFVFMGNVPKKGRAGFSREQLGWLEETLKAPAPARKFFFAHVPPRAPFKKIDPGLASLLTPRLENEEEFLEILIRNHVVLAAFGHRHVHASSVYRGVLMVITGGGGQRNFLDPEVKEPRFTKKRHYTLVDIPRPGPNGSFEGVLSCMGKGHEVLSIASFVQADPFASGGDIAVVLRPYPSPAGGPYRPGDPAVTRLGVSSRTP
ncbi:MAG: metallophosphoesterase family protein [Candidatus Aminicenantes bacterium RBG_16_66_30]